MAKKKGEEDEMRQDEEHHQMDRDEELDTRHTSDEDLHLYAGNEVASAPRWRNQ